MAYFKTVTVEVDVDVHTEDIDPEFMKSIYGEDINKTVDELYVAFKLSRNDHALVLARRLVEQHTGKIL